MDHNLAQNLLCQLRNIVGQFQAASFECCRGEDASTVCWHNASGRIRYRRLIVTLTAHVFRSAIALTLRGFVNVNLQYFLGSGHDTRKRQKVPLVHGVVVRIYNQQSIV